MLTADYDTFGDAAAQAARARAAAEASAVGRPQIIPGGVIDDFVAPAAAAVGVRLLQKMGWRPGRGVGAAGGAMAPGGKWGAVAGVGVENTPIYVLEPKEDLHGLGYDPFQDAEEFRAARQQRRRGGGAGAGSSGRGGGRGGGAEEAVGAKRGRGVAFGAGAGKDDDVCGVEFEDYVDEEQMAMGRKGARRVEMFAYEDASESGEGAVWYGWLVCWWVVRMQLRKPSPNQTTSPTTSPNRNNRHHQTTKTASASDQRPSRRASAAPPTRPPRY